MEVRRVEPNTRMSKAVIANGFVFVSGQVPDDTSENVAGQTRQVLDKIDAILAETGCDKSHVVQASIWLDSRETFNEMNEVWDAWVIDGAAPARACVESALALPPIKVEISVIAAV